MIDELLLEFGPALKRHQVALREAGDEVFVEAALLSWEEIGPDEERALATYLRRAEGEIRFAACQVRDSQALLVVRLARSDIEETLPSMVERVLKVRRAMEREAGALLRPEVAREYLRFQGGEPDISAVGERN